ncbi:MAG TPA: NAD-dependent succinate-semialdehyde dehydrogenase, partial [Streptosporangiaceae bacterium]|nr:NAD-dependent succinate-semialdehyde dehydrogenase [Streptosporangiaceae bacterium]
AMEAGPMMYQVVNPATGKVESEYPTATDAEISDVLARADAGYKSWRRTSLEERAEILRRVSQLYRDRSDELASIITREMGKVTAAAKGELKFASLIYRYYADHGAELLADQPLDTNLPGKAWVRKSPIGALLGIMPWNYPYYQVARFAAPNLMIGNTIILKHAPQCPESALAMQQIFRDAGLPEDAYINIFASNEQVAEIIADPRIAGVSVTGSERAGSAVAATAGQHLKKVVLELGGSDPFIVLDGADLPAVAKTAAAARMENGGQACNSSKRMIVADSVYNEFLREFTAAMSGYVTGDPTDPGTSYGPLSSEQAAQTIMEQIEDAVNKGAQVELGGKRLDRPGSFVEPTVLTGVTPEMRAYREELFGPAAVVYKVRDADEAVELANSSTFGLGGAVFSSDEQLAMDVANQLDVGMAWINSAEGGGPDLPFGGTKRSGVGRELGPLGIDEFVNKKLMHTPPES